MNQLAFRATDPTPAADADPILSHYRDWQVARAEWYALSELPGNGNSDHPDSRASEQREWAALQAMLATRPTSLAGFAALADVLWSLEGPSLEPGNPDFPAQADWTGNRLIRHIWEAASGQTGFPPSSVESRPGPALNGTPALNRE